MNAATPRPSARPTVATSLTALALGVLFALGGAVQPVGADEHEDVVGDVDDLDEEDPAPVVSVAPGGEERYEPAEVTIAPGGEVEFHWADDGHSVSHRPAEEDEPPAFDSHPTCRERLGVPRTCGEEGDVWRTPSLDEPGTYEFGCHLHDDMTGTIEVVEGADDGDDSEDDPTDEVAEDDEASGDGDDEKSDENGDGGNGDGEAGTGDEESGDGDDTAGGDESDGGSNGEASGDEEADAGSSTGGSGASSPPPSGFSLRERSGSAPGGGADRGAPTGGDPTPAFPGHDTEPDPEAPDMPDVEADDPDLEPFPDEPDASAGAQGEVTLPGRDRDRTVPIALAALGVAGTGGVALREVMLVR